MFTDSSPKSEQLNSANSLPKKENGYFQCGFCKRHYNRADHLIRHVRSHTREKPYVCDICDKGFARPDLLKRHVTGHANDRDRKRKRSSSVIKQSRVSQACRSCATSKLKCDDDKPCRRCRERNQPCDWQDASQDSSPEPAPQRNIFDTPAQSNSHMDLTTSPAVTFSPMPTPLEDFSAATILMTPRPSLSNNMISPEVAHGSDELVLEAVVSPNDHESGIFSIDGTFFPNFIPDSLIPSLARYNDPDPSQVASEYVHYGALDNLHFDFTLTDGDFGLIDLYNSRSLLPNFYTQNYEIYDTDSGIGIGAEAYHRSSLSAWKPAPEDHAFNDHENLSVPQVINSPETGVLSERACLCERLTSSSRDLILSLVLEVSREASLSRIVKSFPSTDLLDGLIQQYFELQKHTVQTFIHMPTFQTNAEDPGVLAGLAAAGAVLSPVPTIRKLGYALNEMVRLHLPGKYERDNTFTRDLRTSQIYAITIDIGIWSGNRRKTEIAESFAQPLITMLRRGLRFRRSVYTNIVPLAEDAGPVLEEKWHAWVEQESYKRLVYHLFMHDSQTAMSLNVNPIISYADMELPLPASRQLWEAKSATEWKDLFGGMTPERLPSLADLLRDMSQLTIFQDRVDTQFAASILIHGLAALINEYHRLKFISTNTSKHWHALVTNSRQQELDQALQHFRMVCSELRIQCRPETMLVCEVVSMLLHMSLEELQLFAGKEDKQEARRVYHSALEWIASSDSRRAVWHAGQVIRAARSMPPGSVTGFLAIGVYYAGLAFWSYSVVSKANTARITGTPHSPPELTAGPTVLLDGHDIPDVSKFVTLACGSPALQGPRGAVYLVDPGSTMDVLQAILRMENSDRTPPLVQMLAQLMGDLGHCVRGG
ncbi:uncharacterized protein N7511_007104 [Penicillium nucicola]|uniref:uncharacterized protein n=1 Tax=Penicillium nucicola TaxID=1850975 RepID=UPI002544E164|nr:uncharacterized protein N7511_007104 [Penicillium nucicola]KAJ5756922.1 hypothetical protein N7511_007104 [Penicillium nucicola]